ncbi:neutral zinc metallopeptidase [Propionibacterium australiense]|uniref:neutral zinc metallopeptidase n=1 Tax=Propionibacterium australiense TaxID=119981 RepID=UPI001476FA07|nr:neutral zinc metallopeptidase [Propionibacterium australiense]
MSQWGQPNQQWPNQRWPGQQWPAPSAQPGYGQWPVHNQWPAQGQGAFPPPVQGYQQAAQFPRYVGAPTPPRRRKSSPLKFLFALFGVFAVMVLAYVVMSYTNDGAPSSQTTHTGSYENEDYEVPNADTNPPGIPQPETYAEATELMENNSLYGVTIANPVRCELDDLDLSTATDPQLEEHFNELTACLMRVWAPALEEAGYEAVRPTVTVYSTPISTPCGDMPMENAAYCMLDQQIYYASDLTDIIPQDLSNVPHTADAVMAHEFGHAIQARTGILYSEKAWESRVSDSQADELSRRTEVQADCFAGEFTDAVSESLGLTTSDIDGLSDMFYAFGDDVLTGDSTYEGNHGSGRSRQRWFLDGVDDQLLATCYAFTAPASSVR